MTSPDTKNLSNFLQEQENVSQTIFGQTEVDGTSLADVMSLYLQQNNKNFQSQVVKLIKSIVRVSSGVTLAAGISFINPKQVHALCIEVPVYTTTTSTLTTSSVKSSSSPLNSLGVSHACNVNIPVNKNSSITHMDSSALRVNRATAYQSRIITKSEDPFSRRCSAILLRQPSAQILFQNSFQEEKKNPIFSKENFGLMGLIGFKCKKRRSIGRLHLSKIRQKNHNCKSSKLQYRRDLSLCEIVNSTKVMPIRTK